MINAAAGKKLENMDLLIEVSFHEAFGRIIISSLKFAQMRDSMLNDR